jgi:hypothetical protein
LVTSEQVLDQSLPGEIVKDFFNSGEFVRIWWMCMKRVR